jgi:hypothetical protein
LGFLLLVVQHSQLQQPRRMEPMVTTSQQWRRSAR